MPTNVAIRTPMMEMAARPRSWRIRTSARTEMRIRMAALPIIAKAKTKSVYRILSRTVSRKVFRAMASTLRTAPLLDLLDELFFQGLPQRDHGVDGRPVVREAAENCVGALFVRHGHGGAPAAVDGGPGP